MFHCLIGSKVRDNSSPREVIYLGQSGDEAIAAGAAAVDRLPHQYFADASPIRWVSHPKKPFTPVAAPITTNEPPKPIATQKPSKQRQ